MKVFRLCSLSIKYSLAARSAVKTPVPETLIHEVAVLLSFWSSMLYPTALTRNQNYSGGKILTALFVVSGGILLLINVLLSKVPSS